MKKVMENDAHRVDEHFPTIQKTSEVAASGVAHCTKAERGIFFYREHHMM